MLRHQRRITRSKPTKERRRQKQSHGLQQRRLMRSTSLFAPDPDNNNLGIPPPWKDIPSRSNGNIKPPIRNDEKRITKKPKLSKSKTSSTSKTARPNIKAKPPTQTLSDLFTKYLFQSNYRGAEELVEKHVEITNELYNTAIRDNPLSPESIALTSLTQLHHVHHKLRLLHTVMAYAHHSGYQQQRGYNGQFNQQNENSTLNLPSSIFLPHRNAVKIPINLNLKNGLNDLVPILPKATGKYKIQKGEGLNGNIAGKTKTQTTLITLSQLDQFFHVLATPLISASLAPVVSAVDKVYFDNHLKSVMSFVTPTINKLVNTAQFKTFFSSLDQQRFAIASESDDGELPKDRKKKAWKGEEKNNTSSSQQNAQHMFSSTNQQDFANTIFYWPNHPLNNNQDRLRLLPQPQRKRRKKQPQSLLESTLQAIHSPQASPLISLFHNQSSSLYATEHNNIDGNDVKSGYQGGDASNHVYFSTFLSQYIPLQDEQQRPLPSHQDHLHQSSTESKNLQSHSTTSDLRPSVDIILVSGKTTSSVASFTGTYSVVKPQSRASHTRNQDFTDDRDLSSVRDIEVTNHTLTTSSNNNGDDNNSNNNNNPSTIINTIQSHAKSNPQSKSHSHSSSGSSYRRGKVKSRGSVMSREKNGFFEFAFLPPIIAPHHSTLSEEYLQSHTNQTKNGASDKFQKKMVTSGENDHSIVTTKALAATHSASKHYNPLSTHLTKQSLEEQQDDRQLWVDNHHFFKVYPVPAKFNLTVESHSMHTLFKHRLLLSPTQLDGINDIINRPLEELFPKVVEFVDRINGHEQNDTKKPFKQTPITICDLSRSLSLKYIHEYHFPSSLDEINLFHTPFLLENFNKLLDYLIMSIPHDYIKAVQSDLAMSPLSSVIPDSIIGSDGQRSTMELFSSPSSPMMNKKPFSSMTKNNSSSPSTSQQHLTSQIEQSILYNAFNHTFDNFEMADTPRNNQRRASIDKDDPNSNPQNVFISSIYPQSLFRTDITLPSLSSKSNNRSGVYTQINPPSNIGTPSPQQLPSSTLSPLSPLSIPPKIRGDLLLHTQGLPLLSGLQGLISILQHELLHAGIFIHAPHLWTCTTEKTREAIFPTKTMPNQRQMVQLVTNRFEQANQYLPVNNINYGQVAVNGKDGEIKDGNQNKTRATDYILDRSVTTHSHQTNPNILLPDNDHNKKIVWEGNILPSLLKTRVPGRFWEKNEIDQVPLEWSKGRKTSHLSLKRHVSNLNLVEVQRNDDGDCSNDDGSKDGHNENKAKNTTTTSQSHPKTSISSHQDGHSLAFRLLARNLFGHNKINVSLNPPDQ